MYQVHKQSFQGYKWPLNIIVLPVVIKESLSSFNYKLTVMVDKIGLTLLRKTKYSFTASIERVSSTQVMLIKCT